MRYIDNEHKVEEGGEVYKTEDTANELEVNIGKASHEDMVEDSEQDSLRGKRRTMTLRRTELCLPSQVKCTTSLQL